MKNRLRRVWMTKKSPGQLKGKSTTELIKHTLNRERPTWASLKALCKIFKNVDKVKANEKPSKKSPNGQEEPGPTNR